MKNCVIFVAVLVAIGSAWAGKPDPAKHGWYSSYAQGKAEAKRTGKPLMVVFRCEP
jgi:hypothetical protein